MGHKRSLQLASKPRVRASAIPDNTGAAEVGGEPGERSRTFKTPAFRGSGGRPIADMISIQRPLFANQRWLKRQHQTRFGKSCMQSMRKLISRNEGLESCDTTPEKTGKNGHGRRFRCKCAGSGLQQTDLSSVGVEQHETLHTLIRELLAHFLHKANQEFSAEAQGSWKAAVFW